MRDVQARSAPRDPVRARSDVILLAPSERNLTARRLSSTGQQEEIGQAKRGLSASWLWAGANS
ncbi:hypothetical protein GCM10009601_55750 [Streptomyces thermospinosisporus]|uniref:Uncharacterized protein n=1 Tax=Streptomyces thermospinosisporus TaxID=161482 RepID=A0ABN1Z6W3_9ACTN